jgi:EAL domain-containing protein (putative c-di-GMP-specific phosphodiesterase class I)
MNPQTEIATAGPFSNPAMLFFDLNRLQLRSERTDGGANHRDHDSAQKWQGNAKFGDMPSSTTKFIRPMADTIFGRFQLAVMKTLNQISFNRNRQLGSALEKRNRKARERQMLQDELRSALANDVLTLAFQPHARTNGEITGFEALARWPHAKRGMIGPDIFIPLAEDSGMSMEIGEWVLRQACREAASWKEPLQIAVNLSAAQFHHDELPALVQSVLTETGLAPERLELEIQETALAEDYTRAIAVSRQLKDLGVKIVIDDFGAGCSTLSFLRSLPFDKLKIDNSFVAQLEKNPKATAIIRNIIGLAHSLSLPAVAEGVESEEQHAFLEREGCDEVQGFLIDPPKAIDDYAQIVGKADREQRVRDVAA